jgi:hypothetical protein
MSRHAPRTPATPVVGRQGPTRRPRPVPVLRSNSRRYPSPAPPAHTRRHRHRRNRSDRDRQRRRIPERVTSQEQAPQRPPVVDRQAPPDSVLLIRPDSVIQTRHPRRAPPADQFRLGSLIALGWEPERGIVVAARSVIPPGLHSPPSWRADAWDKRLASVSHNPRDGADWLRRVIVSTPTHQWSGYPSVPSAFDKFWTPHDSASPVPPQTTHSPPCMPTSAPEWMNSSDHSPVPAHAGHLSGRLPYPIITSSRGT